MFKISKTYYVMNIVRYIMVFPSRSTHLDPLI